MIPALGLAACFALGGLFVGFLLGERSGYLRALEQAQEALTPDELRSGACL